MKLYCVYVAHGLARHNVLVRARDMVDAFSEALRTLGLEDALEVLCQAREEVSDDEVSETILNFAGDRFSRHPAGFPPAPAKRARTSHSRPRG